MKKEIEKRKFVTVEITPIIIDVGVKVNVMIYNNIIMPRIAGAERARDKNDPADLYAKLWVNKHTHTHTLARMFIGKQYI
jgi:hypothetical protein